MKIKKTISIPYRLVKKVYKSITTEINELNIPESKRYENLIHSYNLAGIGEERNQHIERLNKCLESLGYPKYNEDEGMYSEHLLIFSALANTSFKPNNILEIGTHDGRCASILAKLFPLSNITTLDLSDDDPIFLNSYNRQEYANEFIEIRNQRLQKHKNIRFIQSNSLEVLLYKQFEEQDLIWVDGAHGYPVVTSDITNSIRLLSNTGILMCDDVWKKIKTSDKMYSSIASFETLSSYEDAKIIKAIFFRKRIGKKYNGNYKFVSFSKLIKVV